MSKGKPWSRNELLIAMNLYCKLPFGKLNRNTPIIKMVAEKLNRTPSSLAMKLVNFASLDSALEQKGLKGVSKADRAIWQEFQDNWEQLGEVSEIKFQELLENKISEQEEKITERLVTAKARLKQNFFRTTILNNGFVKHFVSRVNSYRKPPFKFNGKAIKCRLPISDRHSPFLRNVLYG